MLFPLLPSDSVARCVFPRNNSGFLPEQEIGRTRKGSNRKAGRKEGRRGKKKREIPAILTKLNRAIQCHC
jgi:hypothetical protein